MCHGKINTQMNWVSAERVSSEEAWLRCLQPRAKQQFPPLDSSCFRGKIMQQLQRWTRPIYTNSPLAMTTCYGNYCVLSFPLWSPPPADYNHQWYVFSLQTMLLFNTGETSSLLCLKHSTIRALFLLWYVDLYRSIQWWTLSHTQDIILCIILANRPPFLCWM